MLSASRFSAIRPVALRLPVVALLAGVLLSLGLVVPGTGASPAFAAACGCKKPGSGKLIDQADLVVTGTIAAEDDSTMPAQLTLTLDRIYHGTVDTPTLTVAQNPNCPLTGVSIGSRWLVLARGSAAAASDPSSPSSATTEATPSPTESPAATDSSPTAGTTPSETATSSTVTAVPVAIGCNLSGEPTGSRMTAVQARFGSGVAPTRPEPPEPTLTKVETVAPDQFRRMAAPGGAMLVIGLLGLLAVRRLGRAKR